MSATIHGYSERGLVNALFESVAARQDSVLLMEDLLALSWPLARNLPASREGTRRTLRNPEIFVEPGLSDFGGPDVVVIAEVDSYRDGVKTELNAWFVEAKVETMASSARPYEAKGDPWLRTNSSSILHELFLKARFDQILREAPAALNPGVRIYEGEKKERKIGTDPMVLALTKRLASCRHAWFVALTADASPIENRPWPAGKDAFDLLCKIDLKNRPPTLPIVAGDPRGGWPECTSVLTWSDVYTWADTKGLKRVTRAIDRNITKLKFPRVQSMEPQQRRPGSERIFFEACGLTPKPQLSSDKLTWYNADGKAVLTTRVRLGLRGFDDLVAEIYLRNVQRQVVVPVSRLDQWANENEASVENLAQLIPTLPGAARP